MDFWRHHRFIIDVSVRHPTARSHVAVGARGPLKVAEQAAREKTRKYEGMAAGLHAQFVPFILETYGGWSSGAANLVRRWVKTALEQDDTWGSAELHQDLKMCVAVAIQKWNAAAIMASLALARDRL